MVTRREAAQILDIPLEMAHRHGIPPRMSEAELGELLDNPPAWLVQSKANRTGKRPVWDFTYVCCAHHEARDIPVLGPGLVRSVYDGVGSRFAGIVDAAVPEA